MNRTLLFCAALSLAAAACAADNEDALEDESQAYDDDSDAPGLQAQALSGQDYVLKNVKSGRCMGVDGASTANGARIKQFTCDGSSNQVWTLKTLGYADGRRHMINKKSGKCIGVDGASTANGAALMQFPCAATANQWWLMYYDQTDAQFLNWKSDKCIGVDGASTANGAAIKQFFCGDTPPPNQSWLRKQ